MGTIFKKVLTVAKTYNDPERSVTDFLSEQVVHFLEYYVNYCGYKANTTEHEVLSFVFCVPFSVLSIVEYSPFKNTEKSTFSSTIMSNENKKEQNVAVRSQHGEDIFLSLY